MSGSYSNDVEGEGRAGDVVHAVQRVLDDETDVGRGDDLVFLDEWLGVGEEFADEGRADVVLLVVDDVSVGVEEVEEEGA